MTGKVALIGGDEFRAGCTEMDRLILRGVSSQPARVIIVPTAATPENPWVAARRGVSYFTRLGASASELLILDSSQANDESLLTPVLDASLIYFAGGSPDYLLSVIAGSKFLDKLKAALERGAILAGSSAGAMIMGSWMRSPSQGWVQASGIAENVAVLPHHERNDPERVAEEIMKLAPIGVKVLGIDGMTCCLGRPNDWKVLGRGRVTVYSNRSWASFGPGEILSKGF